MSLGRVSLRLSAAEVDYSEARSSPGVYSFMPEKVQYTIYKVKNQYFKELLTFSSGYDKAEFFAWLAVARDGSMVAKGDKLYSAKAFSSQNEYFYSVIINQI